MIYFRIVPDKQKILLFGIKLKKEVEPMKHLRDSLSKMGESYVEISSLTSAEKESTYGGAVASNVIVRDAECYGVEFMSKLP